MRGGKGRRGEGRGGKGKGGEGREERFTYVSRSRFIPVQASSISASIRRSNFSFNKIHAE